jgi:hypothetical protein
LNIGFYKPGFSEFTGEKEKNGRAEKPARYPGASARAFNRRKTTGLGPRPARALP